MGYYSKVKTVIVEEKSDYGNQKNNYDYSVSVFGVKLDEH